MLAAVGITSISGLACSAAATALGAADLGSACQTPGGIVGGAASQVVGFGVNSVLDAVAGWVSAGGVWLLGQIGTFLIATTSVDLGASWFLSHYQTMAGLAAVVIVPLSLLGVMQAIHRQSASMLIRSLAINVPLALLLTAVAVKLVQLGLALTDSMSATVAHGTGLDTGHFLEATTFALSGSIAGGPQTPTFVLLLGSLAVVFGAFLLWVELLVRSAAVYVAVLFLPLALASLAWPTIAHWCRRLVDTLVALILGKFVIVSVLSLAAGALAGGSASTPTSSTGSGASQHGSFTDVLGGAALLLLAACAPWALFRLLPFLEAGAVGHLEGAGRQAFQVATGPPKSLAQTAMGKISAGTIAASNEVGKVMASAGGSSVKGNDARREGGAASSPAAASASGTPDLGPSSFERHGVGTASPPGASVPTFRANVASKRAYDQTLSQGLVDGPLVDERTSSHLGPLPSGSRPDRPHIPGS